MWPLWSEGEADSRWRCLLAIGWHTNTIASLSWYTTNNIAIGWHNTNTIASLYSSYSTCLVHN